MKLQKLFAMLAVTSSMVAAGVTRVLSHIAFSRFTRSMPVAVLLILLLSDAGGWFDPPSNVLSAAPGMGAAAQTEVPCKVTPPSGPQGATVPVRITLGPHPIVTTLILLFTPDQLQGISNVNFLPDGVQMALQAVSYVGTDQIIYTGVLTIDSNAPPGVRDLLVSVQPSVNLSCSRSFRVETPEEFIEGLNETFRAEVAEALQQISRQIRLPIRTNNFAALLSQDGTSVIVNAGLTGVENLTLEQLARGADVLVVFLQLPQDSALPSGFYVVRILQLQGAAQWRAQFKNLRGQVVLQTEAEVGPGDPAIRQFVCTIGELGELILIDEHDANKSIRISVPIGTGRPDQTPLPAAGQAIVEAAGNFYQAAVGYNSSRSNVQRQVIGTRDDALTVLTVFRGVERLTLEQLARGQDVFFGYFREPLTPAGFYTFHVFQDEAGRWWRVSNSSERRVQMYAERVSPVDHLSTIVDMSWDRVRMGVIIPQGPQSLAISDCGYDCPNPY